MTTRLDLAIQQHPNREEAIRLLASRDPSGNLKYLHWQIGMLGQALAPEIADVVDLFHRFRGQPYSIHPNPGGRHSRDRIRPDLYSYRPQDFATLRDGLLKIKRAQDKKRRTRERLYCIEGAVEADVVYDSPDLVVRHIKNKQASVHYGLGTKWCISMNREEYFRDYETQNAAFFFFERTAAARKNDEYDKVAAVIGRDAGSYVDGMSCFTSLDEQVDVFSLVKAYGMCVFSILHAIYACSERYPGSMIARVYGGTATAEQLEAAFAIIGETSDPLRLVEAICCNDAASWALLERIAVKSDAWNRPDRAVGYRRRYRSKREGVRTVSAALSIHPQVPAEMREQLTKQLRRYRVVVQSIHLEKRSDGVGVSYKMPGSTIVRGRRFYRRRHVPLGEMVRRVGMYERMLKRMKKKVQKLKQEKAAKAKKVKGRR